LLRRSLPAMDTEAVKNLANHQYSFSSRLCRSPRALGRPPRTVRATASVVMSILSHVEKKDWRALSPGKFLSRTSWMESRLPAATPRSAVLAMERRGSLDDDMVIVREGDMLPLSVLETGDKVNFGELTGCLVSEADL